MIKTAEEIRWSRPTTARGMKGKANKKLEDLYIRPILPVRCDFHFVSTTLFLNTYQLLTVKQMHMLPLAVSWLLNDTAEERLRHSTKTTDNYKSTKRSISIFALIGTVILQDVTAFIDGVIAKQNGNQVGMQIQKPEGHPGLNGVFTDDGLAGMLEAADIKMAFYHISLVHCQNNHEGSRTNVQSKPL